MTVNHVDPEQWLERCRAGDPQAVEWLVRTHQAAVYRLALSILDDPAEADEAAQETFLAALRRLGTFRGEAAFTTWLYAIAVRVARRYRTRLARDARDRAALEPEELDTAQAEEPATARECVDVHTELEQAERLELARRALAVLDDDKREAFVLGCVEQRAAPEIAQLTGTPLNTVYSRIRAARRLFAAEVARLESLAGRRAR